MATEFSDKLRMLRVQLRVTQKELASRIGISPGAIHKYENNQMKPTLRTIAKVEEFINQQDLDLELSTDPNQKVEVTDMQVRDLIDSQKETIELQREKIKSLQAKVNQAENVTGTLNIEADFSAPVQFNINFATLETQISYGDADYKILANKLGYTEDEIKNEFFCVGQFINYSKHPIHNLRHQDAKDGMVNTAYNVIKSVMKVIANITSYEFSLPTYYLHKDGTRIDTFNNYKVNFLTKTATWECHFNDDINALGVN